MGMQPRGVVSSVAGPVGCTYADRDTGNTTVKNYIFYHFLYLDYTKDM